MTWIRYPANPIVTSSWVEDVCVVKQGDTYYMIAEGERDIAHLLTSTDRVTWLERGPLDIRLKSGEPIPPGPRGTPAVFVRDGVWHLFYERGDRGVWLATTRDPVVGPWVNVQDEPVLAMGPDAYDSSPWRSTRCSSATACIMPTTTPTATTPGRRTGRPTSRGRRDLVHWEKYAGQPPDRNELVEQRPGRAAGVGSRPGSTRCTPRSGCSRTRDRKPRVSP